MQNPYREARRVVIIGAGPAGLTAAYELGRLDVPSVVLEKDDVVGGLARTVRHRGYYFDIGGHRFFTKVSAVDAMWRRVLGPDFVRRKRMSRIYYNGRFFHYPLRAGNALCGLGIWSGILMVLSYLRARVFPIKNERTFEDWVSNRFGRRLFRVFFKTYTEKVWGMPTTEISSEWAAQRIKGLSLVSALKNALVKRRKEDAIVTTLIDFFDYPRRGPGMMWEEVADQAARNGCTLRLGTCAQKIFWAGNAVEGVQVSAGDRTETVRGTHFIASMPMREFVQGLDPPPPQPVLDAASRLRYRDFLTVGLVIDKREVFPDNWIYVHEDSVKVGRIQNFKNWGPDMVPDPEKTSIGLEYFCFEGDDLWSMADERLIELAKAELQALRLVQASDVEDGIVVRMPKAYPVYDETYAASVATIREFVDGLHNLQLVGRNGMHRYNNQDHSMYTAMLAVKNIMGADFDLWNSNVDRSYDEELTEEEARILGERAALEASQPRVPSTVDEASVRATLEASFARTARPAQAGRPTESQIRADLRFDQNRGRPCHLSGAPPKFATRCRPRFVAVIEWLRRVYHGCRTAVNPFSGTTFLDHTRLDQPPPAGRDRLPTPREPRAP